VFFCVLAFMGPTVENQMTHIFSGSKNVDAHKGCTVVHPIVYIFLY